MRKAAGRRHGLPTSTTTLTAEGTLRAMRSLEKQKLLDTQLWRGSYEPWPPQMTLAQNKKPMEPGSPIVYQTVGLPKDNKITQNLRIHLANANTMLIYFEPSISKGHSSTIGTTIRQLSLCILGSGLKYVEVFIFSPLVKCSMVCRGLTLLCLCNFCESFVKLLDLRAPRDDPNQQYPIGAPKPRPQSGQDCLLIV